MKHKTEIYEMGRGEGKTYKMLKMSEELKIPILCGIQSQLNILERLAKENNINIVEPILYNNINRFIKCRVLIDDIGILFGCVCAYTKENPMIQCTDDIIYFIEKKIGCEIYACTYTSNRLKDKKEKEIGMKIRIKNFEKEANELGYDIIKKEKEEIFDIKQAKENSDKNFKNKLNDIFKEISKRIEQASNEGIYYIEFPSFREKDVRYGEEIIKKLKDKGYNISDQVKNIFIRW